MIPYSDAFKSALLSPTKELYVKFELYTSNMVYIDEISKQVTQNDVGSISIDRSRPIRRSFSFSLYNGNGDFNWGTTETIWIDKRVKVFTGLKLADSTIEYIPQGIFILTEPTTTHVPNSSITTLNGQDKTYLYSDKRGKLQNTLIIASGTAITTAIKTVATGETLYNFDNVTDTVPYELTYNPTDNIWKVLQDLAAFAKSEIYYDYNGYLRLRKVTDLNDYQNESAVWTFTKGDMFYAGNVRKMDETNLYNDFICIGAGTNSAIVRNQLTVTESNPLFASSPFSIEKLGRITYFHNNGNADPVIITQDDAKYRNKYNLMQYLGYAERVSMNIAPLFVIDAMDIVEIDDDSNGVSGRYIIDKFDIPLKPQVVTVEASKEYHVVTDWNAL